MQVFAIELSTPSGLPELVQSADVPDPIESIDAKPGTGPLYGVQFMRDGVLELLSAGSALKYTIKPENDLASTSPVVFAGGADWTTPGTAAGYYTARVSYNTVQLNALVAASATQSLLGAFSWAVGADDPEETRAFSVALLPRVNNGDENDPTYAGPSLGGRLAELELKTADLGTDKVFAHKVAVDEADGFVGNLLELKVDGALKFSVNENGVPTGLRTAVKAADLTRTSNVTPAADLQFTIAANEKWQFEFVVYFASATAGATPGFKFGLSGPAAPTRVLWEASAGLNRSNSLLTASGVNTAYGVNTETAAAGGAGGTVNVCVVKGIVENGATAGNVAFTWAQANTSATGTTVKAGSHLTATRLG